MTENARAKLNSIALEKNIPVNVSLDITSSCNQRCSFCCKQKSKPELSAPSVFTALEELSTMGSLFLLVSGGEPLAHRDFFPILQQANQLAFALRLNTNGILLDQKNVEALRTLNLQRVQVSLLGPNEDIHEKHTGVPGSFARVRQAVRLLNQAAIRNKLSCVLTPDNIRCVPEMRRLAATWETHISFDHRMLPSLRFSPEEDLGISDPMLLELLEKDDELCRSFLGQETGDLSPDPEKPLCSAVRSQMHIDECGDIFPCRLLPIRLGNVREGIEKVWRESRQAHYLSQLKLKDLRCISCSSLRWCVPCIGRNLMDTGSLFSPSENVCRFARLKAKLHQMLSGESALPIGNQTDKEELLALR